MEHSSTILWSPAYRDGVEPSELDAVVAGALVLDPSAYENVEADRHSAMQSVVVVMAICVAGGVGAIGFGLVVVVLASQWLRKPSTPTS